MTNYPALPAGWSVEIHVGPVEPGVPVHPAQPRGCIVDPEGWSHPLPVGAALAIYQAAAEQSGGT